MFGWTTHLAALAATAVLLALSFPLPGWGFLAWVALVPAGWLAATSRKPGRLVVSALLIFVLWWVWMLRWLWPVTLPGALAMASFQALFWVAALWGTNIIVRRKRWPIALVLPVMWVAFEWLRGTFPFGGFGWFMLGHTQGAWSVSRPPWWAQFAGITGGLGFSLILAYVSGVLVTLRLRTTRIRKFLYVLSLAGLFVWSFCINALESANAKISRSPHFGTQVTVAVIQTNHPHDNKLSPTAESQEEDFAVLAALHAEAAAQNPDLIVWPETVIPGEFNDEAAQRWRMGAHKIPPDDPYYDYFQAVTAMPFRARDLIAEHGVPTVVGASTEIQPRRDVEAIEHNSAFLVDADGQAVARYDKMHLVPFGEYIPGPGWVKETVFSYFSPYDDFDYTIDPGELETVFESPIRVPRNWAAVYGLDPSDGVDADDQPEWEEGTLRFATPICFEDTVGRLCRRMVFDAETGEKRVDALVNLTNDGWFGRLPSEGDAGGGLGWRSMRLQHLQLASIRAIENRVPMVRSVNTGVSAVIGSTGRIVAMAEPGESAVVTGTVVLDGRVTLYARVGEVPIMVLSAAAGVMWLWAASTQPRRLRRRRR